MNKSNKINPQNINTEINLLLNEKVKVNKNAVEGHNNYSSPEDIIKGLKRAASKNIFPPILNSSNG
jgi:hypothetical protein